MDQVHPLGKSPVIGVKAHRGRILAESARILEYLVERFDDQRDVAQGGEFALGWKYALKD